MKYIIIPLWFAAMMNGRKSEKGPDVFAYTKTKGGRCAVAASTEDYYDFDTLVHLKWNTKSVILPADSFSVGSYTVH